MLLTVVALFNPIMEVFVLEFIPEVKYEEFRSSVSDMISWWTGLCLKYRNVMNYHCVGILVWYK